MRRNPHLLQSPTLNAYARAKCSGFQCTCFPQVMVRRKGKRKQGKRSEDFYTVKDPKTPFSLTPSEVSSPSSPPLPHSPQNFAGTQTTAGSSWPSSAGWSQLCTPSLHAHAHIFTALQAPWPVYTSTNPSTWQGQPHRWVTGSHQEQYIATTNTPCGVC